MKDFKYKKQVLFGISFILFLCALALFIFYFTFINKTILVSSKPLENTNDNIIEIVIPDANTENTKLKISDTKNKVENVTITLEHKLDSYNLYYFIKADSDTTDEVTDKNYTLFKDKIILDENCTLYLKYELNRFFSNNNYEIKISNIEIPEITSEKASEEELEKEKVNKKETAQNTSPYYIKVNYGANTVTIYKKDKDGKYTVPVKAMVCSCGTYTPRSGTYKTSSKYRWGKLIHDVYGQYATRIVGSILFHSVPYSTNKNDALLYNQYDKLGTKASAGCVRLTVADAKWIYNNCPRGTMVEFYSSSNPGPLGKPSAKKIASNVECRNWDPTDPASGNPWHTYKAEDKNDNNVNNTTINPSENNTVTENTTNNVTNSNTNTIVDNKPSANEPTVDEPIVNEPSIDKTTVDKTTVDKPSVDNPIVDKPIIDNSNTDEPSTENPPVDISSDDSSEDNSDSSDSPASNIIKNEI